MLNLRASLRLNTRSALRHGINGYCIDRRHWTDGATITDEIPLHRRILEQNQMNANKPTCQARTRKGTPCQCTPLPGKRRCKLHGGLSTGPKTPEGRARSAQNLAIRE